jgi:hypothetical protein
MQRHVSIWRHCEERERRSNPTFVLAGAEKLIASLTLAMTIGVMMAA